MRATLVLGLVLLAWPRGGWPEPPVPRSHLERAGPVALELDDCDDDEELAGRDERCLPEEDEEEAADRRDRAEDEDRDRLLEVLGALDPDERDAFCDDEAHESVCAGVVADDPDPPYDWAE
jgi:hypothetical protein